MRPLQCVHRMSSASKSSRSARSSAAARAASPHAGSTPPQPASPNVTPQSPAQQDSGDEGAAQESSRSSRSSSSSSSSSSSAANTTAQASAREPEAEAEAGAEVDAEADAKAEADASRDSRRGSPNHTINAETGRPPRGSSSSSVATGRISKKSEVAAARAAAAAAGDALDRSTRQASRQLELQRSLRLASRAELPPFSAAAAHSHAATFAPARRNSALEGPVTDERSRIGALLNVVGLNNGLPMAERKQIYSRGLAAQHSRVATLGAAVVEGQAYCAELTVELTGHHEDIDKLVKALEAAAVRRGTESSAAQSDTRKKAQAGIAALDARELEFHESQVPLLEGKLAEANKELSLRSRELAQAEAHAAALRDFNTGEPLLSDLEFDAIIEQQPERSPSQRGAETEHSTEPAVRPPSGRATHERGQNLGSSSAGVSRHRQLLASGLLSAAELALLGGATAASTETEQAERERSDLREGRRSAANRSVIRIGIQNFPTVTMGKHVRQQIQAFELLLDKTDPISAQLLISKARPEDEVDHMTVVADGKTISLRECHDYELAKAAIICHAIGDASVSMQADLDEVQSLLWGPDDTIQSYASRGRNVIVTAKRSGVVSDATACGLFLDGLPTKMSNHLSQRATPAQRFDPNYYLDTVRDAFYSARGSDAERRKYWNSEGLAPNHSKSGAKPTARVSAILDSVSYSAGITDSGLEPKQGSDHVLAMLKFATPVFNRAEQIARERKECLYCKCGPLSEAARPAHETTCYLKKEFNKLKEYQAADRKREQGIVSAELRKQQAERSGLTQSTSGAEAAGDKRKRVPDQPSFARPSNGTSRYQAANFKQNFNYQENRQQQQQEQRQQRPQGGRGFSSGFDQSQWAPRAEPAHQQPAPQQSPHGSTAPQVPGPAGNWVWQGNPGPAQAQAAAHAPHPGSRAGVSHFSAPVYQRADSRESARHGSRDRSQQAPHSYQG